MYDNVMQMPGGFGQPSNGPELKPNEVSAVPSSGTSQAPPAPPPQPRPNFSPQQQAQQMSEAQQQAFADKVTEQIPQMPSFPGLVGAIDKIGRSLPWYIWFVAGAFAFRYFTKYMRK